MQNSGQGPVFTTHQEKKRFKHMLDLENSAIHTPFFVSIIKGYLEMAELLLVDEMSNINHKD